MLTERCLRPHEFKLIHREFNETIKGLHATFVKMDICEQKSTLEYSFIQYDTL